MQFCTQDAARMRLARAYARQLFSGQVHRDGLPAVEHSLRVAERFRGHPDLFCIAALHDVLEDCPEASFDEIYDTFGYRVAKGVADMTRGKEQSWNSYIRQVRRNPDAAFVKIVDIEDNLSRDPRNEKRPMYVKALEGLKELVAH